ncbi:response regulator transcription factor [Aliarcobacter butzleri]|uniref:Response regulator transcription factor n=2 Tax=Aliarcobacter butzleri TaxID=28197 RepID=A0AAW7QF22_9BACT|nr:response regulator transcription factor [Aliarcobacter butzleri]MCP3650430.1 response regulator transcription factor [Arcobacter sp. DNRA7]MCG3657125.1 response regulator transcription factor [Aliarcobacter butzleri]MCG3688298.1 response regulator transcription factor [Aliarcobacter butzleri]MCG3709295.1 response regulator transcription factor [Aliarcobacter butzleri]MCR1816603.1 response regulator transcription factor [Aliarcobacter butzleri]
MKIFLLEDDFALNKIIKISLQNRGFFVDSFSDGYKAVDVILNSKYDLYILDLNVLGFDGHKILEFIRKDDLTVPIIMISAEIDIENIKKSYTLGCNDYIKKPFDFEELFLRIQYHLSHIKKDENSDFIVELGYDFSFNLLEQTLFKSSFEIELTSKEKLLLSLLVKNINNTVTNEMIHEYVWDNKEMEAVSMRTIVHKLKKKLKNGMILNLRAIGYKLIK